MSLLACLCSHLPEGSRVLLSLLFTKTLVLTKLTFRIFNFMFCFHLCTIFRKGIPVSVIRTRSLLYRTYHRQLALSTSVLLWGWELSFGDVYLQIKFTTKLLTLTLLMVHTLYIPCNSPNKLFIYAKFHSWTSDYRLKYLAEFFFKSMRDHSIVYT